MEKERRRGRPRSFDLDQAVATAMPLFHARGYDAVGVAELSAALGVNPPSLYAAFGSKAGIFRRVLERYDVSEANVFAQARTVGGTVADVIERTLLDAARLYAKRGDVAGCLVLDGARNTIDPEARAAVATLRDAGRATIRAFIAGEYPEKADELASLVTIAMAGMSAAARDGASTARLRAFAQATSRAFRREATGS